MSSVGLLKLTLLPLTLLVIWFNTWHCKHRTFFLLVEKNGHAQDYISLAMTQALLPVTHFSVNSNLLKVPRYKGKNKNISWASRGCRGDMSQQCT